MYLHWLFLLLDNNFLFQLNHLHLHLILYRTFQISNFWIVLPPVETMIHFVRYLARVGELNGIFKGGFLIGDNEEIRDFNNCIEQGLYIINHATKDGTANNPNIGYGMLVHLKWHEKESYSVQFVIDLYNPTFAYRSSDYSGIWQSWMRFTGLKNE